MIVLFRFALKIEAELRTSSLRLEQVEGSVLTATRSAEALKLAKVRQKLLYRVELTEPDEDGVTPLDLEKCMKVRKYSQRMEMFPKDGNNPKGWKESNLYYF